jgi:hypothetical protein
VGTERTINHFEELEDIYDKAKIYCFGCWLHDGRRDYQHRGPTIGIGATELWKSWHALGTQYHDGSAHIAASYVESATSDGAGAGNGVGGW